MKGCNNQSTIICFSSWSIKRANNCWSVSIFPDWKEELFYWALTLAVPMVSCDWWNENLFFAQSCSPPDFVCFSMFPLWVELIPSAYLNKLSTTDPRKSLALASTRISYKYWVHILHVTFTTLSSLSTSISKSSL